MLGPSLPGQFVVVGGSGGGGSGVTPPAGQIGGSSASPTVVGITESGGPTPLSIGSISNGQMLVRSGGSIVGQAVPGALTDGDKGDIIVSSSGATWMLDTAIATTAGRALLAGADASAQRTSLGLGTAATSAASAFEVPLTFSAPLVRTTNTISVQQFGAAQAGVVPQSGGGTSNYLRADGTWAAPAGGGGGGLDQLTGDVTAGPGTGSQTATIANNAVTNAKMATMTNNTVKGNVSGSTAAPSDITATQLTVLVNTFTSSLSGAAPASGGGTTNYLRADGTWAAPAGGGGGGILDVQHFQAESLDNATADWTNMVTATAPLAVSPLTNSIQTRSYSGSTSNATGGKFRAPTGATNLKVEWMQQAASAPGTTNNIVQWQLAFRALGSTSSPTTYNFTTKTMPNSTAFTSFTETLSLATIGLTAGTWYQFQLVRIITSVTNNMTVACQLSEFVTTWS